MGVVVDVLLSGGAHRRLTGRLGQFVKAVAAAMAVAMAYSVTISFADLYSITTAFLSVMLALGFLTVGAWPGSDTVRPHPVDYLLAATAAACGVYFAVHSQAIITRISMLDALSPADVLFGSLFLVLTLEAARRTVGLALTLIVCAFGVYNLYGDMLPGEVGHGAIDFEAFLDMLVFTADGLFGVPVRVASTYAFMFVMFGTFIARAGGGEFFFNFAAALSGRQVGGPAKVAVISSGMFGMISGSPVSDVVTTGSLTVPIMKRVGYPAVLAGGIEVAASTGGGIMPPIMGSAAFIMAEYTATPYRDIALAAAIPAVIYYICIFAQVHLRSQRNRLSGLESYEIPRLVPVLKDGGIFIIPLAVLIAVLLMGYSPNRVALVATVTVIGVSLISLKYRLGFKGIYEALAETTMVMVGVAAACAAAGLVVGGMSMTGLGAKFANLLFLVTGDNLFGSLVMSALGVTLLGMGMPTVSVYVLSAVLMAPVLIKLGVGVMPAHMFLLYYASMSAMTPPVAVAAFACAPIAKANPMHIGFAAMRLAITAFILPFAFVYGPELLLIGSIPEIVFALTTATVGVLLLAVAVEGFFKVPQPPAVRLLLGVAGLCLIAPSLLLAGVALVCVLATLAAAPMRQAVAIALGRAAPAEWQPQPVDG